MEQTLKRFASALDSAYDIEFEDPIMTDRSFQSNFEVYNRRQDVFYEGMIFMFVKDQKVMFQVRGGRLGSSVSEQQRFVDTEFSFDEDPMSQIDIVSAFQVLAGK
jgi:hypothetical protein